MTGKPVHGESYSPEYRAWQTARLRCTDPDNAAWPDYGGRGITMCDRWLNSVEAFIEDMGPKPDPKFELDRIDNDKGYVPGNCRWVPRKVNCRNRRSNRLISHAGETLTRVEWSERTGISADLIGERLDRGWTAAKALTTPARPKAPNGEAKSYTRPCGDCGEPCFGKRCRTCENGRRPRGAKGQFASADAARREAPLVAREARYDHG